MSNKTEILSGVTNLLKNVDLEQLTSLISGLNIKDDGVTSRKGLSESKFDLSSINSMISNIGLEDVRSLLSGLNLDNLKGSGLLNLESAFKGSSGLISIEQIQDALNEITERMENITKPE